MYYSILLLLQCFRFHRQREDNSNEFNKVDLFGNVIIDYIYNNTFV